MLILSPLSVSSEYFKDGTSSLAYDSFGPKVFCFDESYSFLALLWGGLNFYPPILSDTVLL